MSLGYYHWLQGPATPTLLTAGWDGDGCGTLLHKPIRLIYCTHGLHSPSDLVHRHERLTALFPHWQIRIGTTDPWLQQAPRELWLPCCPSLFINTDYWKHVEQPRYYNAVMVGSVDCRNSHELLRNGGQNCVIIPDASEQSPRYNYIAPQLNSNVLAVVPDTEPPTTSARRYYYAQSRCGVSPGNLPTDPFTIAEMQLCGLPVVGTATTEFWRFEYCAPKYLRTVAHDPQSIVAAINELSQLHTSFDDVRSQFIVRLNKGRKQFETVMGSIDWAALPIQYNLSESQTWACPL